jgi:hypothetical protein
MTLSFATLATVTTMIVVLTIVVTYVTVQYLRLPFAAVLVAMAVVGLLNAVLRNIVVSNIQEVRSEHVDRPAFQSAGITPAEVRFLSVAYWAVPLVQLQILRSHYTFLERSIVLAVTFASHVLFLSLV